VLNFNFTDDSKTISREEVLGSSAVDNAPPQILKPNGLGIFVCCSAAEADVIYSA